MGTDSETASRKHRHRSASPDGSDEKAKRHKNRHHRHRDRHRRHRRKRDKQEVPSNELEFDGSGNILQEMKLERSGDESGAIAVVVASNGYGFSGVDYDMEEGEIVEDDPVSDFVKSEFEKTVKIDSDMESGEIANRDDISNLNVDKDDCGSAGKNLWKLGKESVDGKAFDAINQERAPSFEDHRGGDCALKIHKDDDRSLGGGRKRPRNSDDEVEPCSRKISSSERRHETVSLSHSHETSLVQSSHRDVLESQEQMRERSQSRSVLEEASLVEDPYRMQIKHKIDVEIERMIAPNGNFRNSSRDEITRKESRCSSNRYLEYVESHYSRETHDRYRLGSRERDEHRAMEKEWEREKARIRDGDRVDRDRKRRSDRGGDVDRDRERDRERDRDMDRGKEKERDRDRNKEECNKNTDRIRGREMTKSRDKDMENGIEMSRRHKKYDRDSDGYRDTGKDSRHRRNSENHFRENSKGSDAENVISKSSLEERGEKNHKGEDEEQEDYQEKIVMQLAEQEEDDLERIKEESRRRKQAILEKYKNQIQQKNEKHSGDMVKKQLGEFHEQVSSVEIAVGNDDNGVNGVESYLPEPSFSVGKSPLEKELAASEGGPIGTAELGDGTPKSERAKDMFCDDIFGESPALVRKKDIGDNVVIEKSGLHENWDDAEGYYGYRFGEILDGMYEIIAAHGKGVFSTVVRAKDLNAKTGDPEEVAIKIIRNNETMYKAGMEELIILKKLVKADPENKRHCVRFLSTFKYRNHLCLVFESLHMNLREVLKKFGRNIGLKLTAVRTYAKQLFIALKHLKNCSVLHCDIKPDNILVNEAKNVLKLCDFGNAMLAGKNEITPYLVSRFYRAPEIILGLPYDHPMDIWSVGCCLYELSAGKVLFPGHTNNDMLRLHMELKGPFPKKMLRKGAFVDQHFDQDLNFLATEEDPVTKKAIRRLLVNVKPKDFGSLISGSPGEDPKMLANFKDMMEKIFVLDPDKRLTVSQALSHPFITGK